MPSLNKIRYKENKHTLLKKHGPTTPAKNHSKTAGNGLAARTLLLLGALSAVAGATRGTSAPAKPVCYSNGMVIAPLTYGAPISIMESAASTLSHCGLSVKSDQSSCKAIPASIPHNTSNLCPQEEVYRFMAQTPSSVLNTPEGLATFGCAKGAIEAACESNVQENHLGLAIGGSITILVALVLLITAGRVGCTQSNTRTRERLKACTDSITNSLSNCFRPKATRPIPASETRTRYAGALSAGLLVRKATGPGTMSSLEIQRLMGGAGAGESETPTYGSMRT